MRDHADRSLSVALWLWQASMALLFIATCKFSRPLAPVLPPAILLRLQSWMLDKSGKNHKAAHVVCSKALAPCLLSHDVNVLILLMSYHSFPVISCQFVQQHNLWLDNLDSQVPADDILASVTGILSILLWVLPTAM